MRCKPNIQRVSRTWASWLVGRRPTKEFQPSRLGKGQGSRIQPIDVAICLSQFLSIKLGVTDVAKARPIDSGSLAHEATLLSPRILY